MRDPYQDVWDWVVSTFKVEIHFSLSFLKYIVLGRLADGSWIHFSSYKGNTATHWIPADQMHRSLGGGWSPNPHLEGVISVEDSTQDTFSPVELQNQITKSFQDLAQEVHEPVSSWLRVGISPADLI